ncbi:MAG: class I SAM-dependent methyltransferase [Chloroflexi bacterium]|nr:class I SAM-dependent methyltransferase [Chloroflexota bacterium]
MTIDRNTVSKFFREGWWRRPLFAYRLWRAENYRWKNMKDVWEYVGKDRNVAYMMMSSSKNEEQVQNTGQRIAQALKQGLDIEPNHQVLEIGCGVARIGRELAPHCGDWWGCDISSSIIRVARQRTAHLKNVHFQTLNDSSLQEFDNNTFDRTYCHAVFMHLPQIDVFSYIREMCRVTKPGGIIFYDAFNLDTENGWGRFIWEIEHYDNRQTRPIHHSRFSNTQELTGYTQRANLGLLHCLTPGFWVQIVAAKHPVESLAGGNQELSLEQLRARVDPEALAVI